MVAVLDRIRNGFADGDSEIGEAASIETTITRKFENAVPSYLCESGVTGVPTSILPRIIQIRVCLHASHVPMYRVRLTSV